MCSARTLSSRWAAHHLIASQLIGPHLIRSRPPGICHLGLPFAIGNITTPSWSCLTNLTSLTQHHPGRPALTRPPLLSTSCASPLQAHAHTSTCASSWLTLASATICGRAMTSDQVGCRWALSPPLPPSGIPLHAVAIWTLRLHAVC